MSQDRDELAFRREEDAQQVDIRRDAGEPIVVGGYVPGRGDRARPIPGDEQFPYFKDVPALLKPRRLLGPVRESGGAVVPAPNLPLVAIPADLLAFEIDVRGIRAVTLFINYLGDAGTLELVVDGAIELPEQGSGNNPNVQFFPIGVVDPTLNTAGALLNCGAWREHFATELRMDATAFTPASPCDDTLVFDVNIYSVFRVRVGDLAVATSGLNLLYVLQR